MTTDTGTANDAAGLYGRFGAPLPPGLEGPAGVRGESAADAGVFGRSDSGLGVVGGSNGGIGVQGHAVAASGVGIQAHHVNSGTALQISNGAIRMGGVVRAAFRVTIPPNELCIVLNHPLVIGDPDALIFLTSSARDPVSAGFTFLPALGISRWDICTLTARPFPTLLSVLVIKQ